MILHITTKKAWEQALQAGIYTAKSLETDGFIHCSRATQICSVAEYNYAGQEDLVLLCINENNLISPVRDEDLYQLNETYPHIYGPVNLDAVVEVTPFTPNSDGSFSLPEQLMGLIEQ